jgi:hypothetical protein
MVKLDEVDAGRIKWCNSDAAIRYKIDLVAAVIRPVSSLRTWRVLAALLPPALLHAEDLHNADEDVDDVQLESDTAYASGAQSMLTVSSSRCRLGGRAYGGT